MSPKRLSEDLIKTLSSKISLKERGFEAFFQDFFRGFPEDMLGCLEAFEWEKVVRLSWRFFSSPRGGEHIDSVGSLRYVAILREDKPFLVDTSVIVLKRLGYRVVALRHPTLRVLRNEKKEIVRIGEGKLETLVVLCLDDRGHGQEKKVLRKALRESLKDVFCIVEDFPKMLEFTRACQKDIHSPRGEVHSQEIKRFLEWLIDESFVFLGCRTYRYYDLEKEKKPWRKVGEGIGLLRNPKRPSFQAFKEGDEQYQRTIPPLTLDFIRSQETVSVTKSSLRSLVHRDCYYDIIMLKQWDSEGKVLGEQRIVGLFSSKAYNTSIFEIPWLRGKVSDVSHQSSLQGHDNKALHHLLERYPRDELFQITRKDLRAVVLGVLDMEERPRLRVFARKDKFGRFMSFLLYIPVNQFSTKLQHAVGRYLAKTLCGRQSATYVLVENDSIARVNYIIGLGQSVKVPSIETLESHIQDMARSWSDKMKEVIEQKFKGEVAFRKQQFLSYFSVAYTDAFLGQEVLDDIENLESFLSNGVKVQASITVPPEYKGYLTFKLYAKGEPIELSAVLPILENMGLKTIKEEPYRLHKEKKTIWLHVYSLFFEGGVLKKHRLKERVQTAFKEIWEGRVDNDSFNRLIPGTGLDVRQVMILRAISRYLSRIGMPVPSRRQSYILLNYPFMCELICQYFDVRLSPKGGNNAKENRIVKAFQKGLNTITSMDEDRVFRRYFNVVEAILRTNFYKPNQECVVFKIKSEKVLDLPSPKPFVETYLCSTKIEGIHLRTSAVARGGLRWSDRLHDFRSEVLGLMKAQQVKNSLIVPSGAKGGFVLRKSDPDLTPQKDALQGYKQYIRGLLSVTDNRIGDKVLHPRGVHCRDKEDPYLVVAADKGTATFSDVANELSKEHGFWLSDAFASGGKQGYDHKAMGITAKGAWESVKRLFLSIGHDVQKKPFTVIGCGGMAGDVFGNGMLLSPYIKLIGSFNHRHIFLDPNPDLSESYKERKQLFQSALSWGEYRKFGKGGGVYERSAKEVPLNAAVRDMLSVEVSSLPPSEVIRALLCAPVDLLWFGGIGVFIKSSLETNEQVQDVQNDVIRVNGRKLRSKVIGEGANLALTQRGRIEAASIGIKVTADFIDNAGGVHCSDREVNIKMALARAVGRGALSYKDRNLLLKKMTGDIEKQVVYDNYLQALALSIEEEVSGKATEKLHNFIQALESEGLLNREEEYLPSSEEMMGIVQRKETLSRPILSVLLCYSKMWVRKCLERENELSDADIQNHLPSYFPCAMEEGFLEDIRCHPLGKEIVYTTLSKDLVHFGGLLLAFELQNYCNCSVTTVARAFELVWQLFDLKRIVKKIESLDVKGKFSTQMGLLGDLRRFIFHTTARVIKSGLLEKMSLGVLVEKLYPLVKIAFKRYKSPGILSSSTVMDMVFLSLEGVGDIETVCSVGDEVSKGLNLNTLFGGDVFEGSLGEQKALFILLSEIFQAKSTLVKQIINHNGTKVRECFKQHKHCIDRIKSCGQGFKNSGYRAEHLILAMDNLNTLIKSYG